MPHNCLLKRCVHLCFQSRRSRPHVVHALFHSLAGAGTPEETGARRWLQAQGGAVKCVACWSHFVEWEAEGEIPGRELDGGRVTTLLASLPALTSFGLVMLAEPSRCQSAAGVRAFLAGAVRAIGNCSSLQQLRLRAILLGREPDQLPEALARELARAQTLEEVDLCFEVPGGSQPCRLGTSSLAHLVAGLAGLTRLRALRLTVSKVGMEATLPACVSCLAQLTSLTLSVSDGLRCAPGWARLPALARLAFEYCTFAGDNEAALPGMDALVALTSLSVEECPSLLALPASLWRLSQLCSIVHKTNRWALADVPRSERLGAGLPTIGAPCFASLSSLSLAGQNLLVFPPGILAATRLTSLDLSQCCFEQLPVGVSALIALTELRLGRHAAVDLEVGGRLDARALGSLAGFPKLRALSFANCCVLFDPSFQAAAAHPCLTRLQLQTSYPGLGASCGAVLAFVITLLLQGRPGVLRLLDGAVGGAGRRDSHRFRAALKAVGVPLRGCSQCYHHAYF